MVAQAFGPCINQTTTSLTCSPSFLLVTLMGLAKLITLPTLLLRIAAASTALTVKHIAVSVAPAMAGAMEIRSGKSKSVIH